MSVSGGYGGQTCFELVRNFIKFFAVSFVLCQLILSQALEECSSALRGLIFQVFQLILGRFESNFAKAYVTDRRPFCHLTSQEVSEVKSGVLFELYSRPP